MILLSRGVSRLQDLDRYDMGTNMEESANNVHRRADMLHSALTTAYRVPEHLDFETSLSRPDLAYLHIATSSATIIFHLASQARNQIDMPSVWLLSNKQCLEAAVNITRVMEMTRFWDPRAVSINIILVILTPAYINDSIISSRSMPFTAL